MILNSFLFKKKKEKPLIVYIVVILNLSKFIHFCKILLAFSYFTCFLLEKLIMVCPLLCYNEIK